ncbi:hypothetical protein GCM10011340_18920 [Roseivirga thermotolerans]|uniref:Uncharacterized protein n=2 Tax=Roseivirga thermotolerans TaxID=1758176 RepID=A0ABQ3I4N2_9BACT|nr:hypothetical protein GCM10011340_18920 [Roseivirga thermotolerans]
MTMSITYTEELQGSINNSNNQFIQEEYDLDHANNAAKISLYYAHGETEKNAINYRNAKIEQSRALNLDNQAVQGVNLATNAATAAKQSLVDSGKATSNISTAAANMQIAANAITKLSSDVAGILAVANAADHGSQIQNSVERAYKKIRKAAKLAEEVSLVSLNATIEAAQSTASTVVTDSQQTVAAMGNFQKSTAAQYSNTSAQAVAGNEGLTEARKNEKAAAGNFDITKKQDKAIKSTRQLINKVSNYNLQLFDPALKKTKSATTDQVWIVPPGESYTISFNKFEGDGLSGNNGSDPTESGYVKYYRLIMVKYDASASFDINVAKDLDVGTYHQIPAKGYSSYARTFYLLGTDQALIPRDPSVPKETDPNSLDATDAKHVRGIAVDYLGKPVEPGEHYVAYVYAVYSDAYQKLISNTDGLLSLPSKNLQLQMDLPKIPKHGLDKDGKSKDNLVLHDPAQLNSRNFAVQFEVKQKDYNPDLMEYRIMLVEKRNVDAQNLNKKVQAALDRLDRAEYNYNRQKQKLQTMQQALNRLEIEFNTTQVNVQELEANQIEVDEKTPVYIKAQQDEITLQLGVLNKKLETNRSSQVELEASIYGNATTVGQQKVVASAYKEYQDALQADQAISTQKIELNVSDFIFDADLMNSVQPANYYSATPFKWTEESAKSQHKEAKETLKLAQLKATDAIKEYAFYDFDLKEAHNAVQEASDKVNEMKTALSKAESDLDKVEMNTSGSTDSQELNDAIAALNTARDNLQLAEAELAGREVDLQIVEANKTSGLSGIQKVLDGYVVASSNNERSTEILELSKKNKRTNRGASATNEVVLFYTETGEDATDNYGEPLQFNDISNWKTTLDIFEKLWEKEAQKFDPFFNGIEQLGQSLEKNLKKLKLQEAAEKSVQETFGHLLDSKDIGPYLKRYLKEVEDEAEHKINEKEALTKAAIDLEKEIQAILKAILEYKIDQEADQLPEEVKDQYLAQKSNNPGISYQAVVLTTIQANNEEDLVNQYRLQHSHYSKPSALWGVVE